MLKQRVFTAVLLAPAAIASIVFLPLSYFVIFITAVILIGFWEWRKFIITNSQNSVFAIAGLITLASLYFILPVSEQGINFDSLQPLDYLLFVGGAWWIAASLMVKRFPKAQEWKENTFLQQSFGWLTLLPFMASVFLLRFFNYDQDPYLGAKLVLLVCILVWAADTGAYFSGRTFGKRKLAPSVSPNKTVEGFVGGLIASIFAMFAFVKGFDIPFGSFSALVIIALITSLASVMGDLAESMFKRVAGVKDSGNILPGHGGILDRIDSLTAAFPIFTLLYFSLA